MATNTDKNTINELSEDTEVSHVAVWIEKKKTMQRISRDTFYAAAGVTAAATVNDATTGTMTRDTFTGTTMKTDTFESAAGGAITVSSDMTTSKAILSTESTATSGFTAGAGGAVTQTTNRSTGVTLSKPCGVITMNTASLAAGDEVTFSVTNSLIVETDVIILSLTNPGSTGTPFAFVSSVGAGSFAITVTNMHAATACTGATLINFAVVSVVSA